MAGIPYIEIGLIVAGFAVGLYVESRYGLWAWITGKLGV